LLSLLLTAAMAVSLAILFPVRLDLPSQSAATIRATYGVIKPSQLGGMLRQKDFTLVNVHIPYDGEIERTDAFVSYNQIDKNLERFPANKDDKIVLYCRSGRMSSLAAKDLIKRGFANVSHLDGGMAAWQAAGYSIVDRPR
jgi:rhodanese-related sulfurtransferase